MKICMFGAGAIGGLIGTRLALAGRAEVSALARGATLQSLRHNGWQLRSADKLHSVAARASDDARELGVQDVVVIAVKGPAMAQVAASIAPLLGATTIVVPAINGVPWWFTQGLPGQAGSAPPLASLDPDGRIAAAIDIRRVIGCVVHAAAATPQPGLVEHRMGRGLILGEVDGQTSPRLAALVDVLADAGFETSASAHIRCDIWFKLWGNLTMNPVSAITGATADRILDDELVRNFCSAAMAEAAAIGTHIGCAIDQSPAERHQLTRQLGAFETSMLQDVRAGRALEIDAIVGAVRELGQRVGVATPNIDALLGLVRLFARVRGLHPEA
jgi:2-dehydropantoate 2-reductase